MPDWMKLKERIVAKVDPKEFYESYDISFTLGQKIPCFNPSHPDSNPSLVIGEGGKFKCFGCDARGSTVVQAYEYIEQLPFQEALLDLAQEYLTDEVIPETLVEKWHARLLKDKERVKFLSETRGATKDLLRNLKLGWNGVQYTIPIFDEYGLCVNIRKYRPGAKQGKLVSYKKGFGKARLLGVDVLSSGARVYLVEGEPDYICAVAFGLPALTTTGGATHWKPEWNPEFVGTHVVIAADRDKQGKAWAGEVAEHLSTVAASVKILDIPYEDGEKDITDYLLRCSVDELYALEKRTKAYSSRKGDTEAPVESNGDGPVTLSEATQSEHYNRMVTLKCQVVGKSVAPYQVPKTAKVTCAGNRDQCMKCHMLHKELTTEFNLGNGTADILDYVDITKQQLYAEIKKAVGIPQVCDVEVESGSMVSIEKVMLAPSVDDDSGQNRHTRVNAYYIGHGLETSGTYNLKSFMTPEPRRQTAVHIITEAGSVYDSLDHYEATPEIMETLRPFRTRSVPKALKALYEVELPKITGILSRADLHQALDLVYFSPIEFTFQGKALRKGWLECLVLGDTQQGKTSAAHLLGDFYGLGEIATGEAATFAGLIGGLSKSGDNWTVNWGLLPRNDRRLVTLDECSGLSTSDIEKMSRVRSEGRAELVKVISQETSARCRFIWLANPRSGHMLNTYSYGVDAVCELIGKSEDISRFDYVLTIASGETDSSVFSKRAAGLSELTYTQEQHRNLVLWAWSRSNEDIVFDPKVEEWIINKAAPLLTKKFHPSFPLVQIENISLKIARVSCAIAARLFSSPDGTVLQVKLAHAKAAVDFLTHCYTKPSLGYEDYSTKQRRAETLEDEEVVIHTLRQCSDEVAVLRGLLWQDTFSQSDIKNITDLDSYECQPFLSALVRNRALISTHNSRYKKSPSFIRLLKSLERRLVN